MKTQWKEQCIKKAKQTVKDLERQIRAVLSREELDQMVREGGRGEWEGGREGRKGGGAG